MKSWKNRKRRYITKRIHRRNKPKKGKEKKMKVESTVLGCFRTRRHERRGNEREKDLEI